MDSKRSSWWSEPLPVPAGDAARLLPGNVWLFRARFEADGTGIQTVRYAGNTCSYRINGRWYAGDWSAPAHVELIEMSPRDSELTVRVERPSGARGVLWPARRLESVARTMAGEVRAEMLRVATERGVASPQPPKHRVPSRVAAARRAG
ncbi:MAG: hypothetical protein ABR552_05635 [Actinomycetota bacterium]